ncbi:MAG: LacI family DNA-binding transcriptional regulator [Phycisphaerales bacterium]
MERITLRQVAEEAGVSLATVSAVLSGKAQMRRIAPQTEKLVWDIGRKLGYQSSRQARKTLTYNVGLILRGRVRYCLGNPFYGEIFHGIEQELDRRGFYLLFSSTQENIESGGMPRVLAQGKVDGLILLGQVPDGYIQKLADFNIPLVCVHFDYFPAVTSVVIDGYEESTQAMRYLASRGHRRIIYLASNTGSQHSGSHERGYVQNLPSEVEPRILRADGADIENGWTTMTGALKHWNPDTLPFTCVLAENDSLAAGAMQALMDARLNVPNDVSVMGGQDLEVPNRTGPAMTTTFVDKPYMGKLAVQHLIEMIETDQSQSLRMTVPTRVIERESVATVRS